MASPPLNASTTTPTSAPAVQSTHNHPTGFVDAPSSPGSEGELRDFRYSITFHQGYHVGQLGRLRRAMGGTGPSARGPR